MIHLILKHTLLSISLLFLGATTVLAQSDLEDKADKQYALGEYAAAAKNYETLQLSGSGYEARLADCYRITNQLAKAEKWYAAAIRKREVASETYSEYIEVLMMQGNYTLAQRYAEVLEQREPRLGKILLENIDFAQQKNKADNDMMIDLLPAAYNTLNSSEFGVAYVNNVMVYSSYRQDMKRAKSTNNKNTAGSHQLFVANMPNVPKGKIQFYKSEFKNTLNEGWVSFSGDGKTVAFARFSQEDGVRPLSEGMSEAAIYIATVTVNGDWVDVKAFPHNSGITSFPHLNQDGTTLFFASSGHDSKGGFDIFASTKNGAYWSSPTNLGSNINTEGDEITPFLVGNSLYFSSNYHLTYGGFDIQKAEKVKNKNGKLEWGNIENIGKSVNSKGDDFGFSYDPNDIGFLTSNRDGQKTDIYIVKPAIVKSVASADVPNEMSTQVTPKSAEKPKVVITEKTYTGVAKDKNGDGLEGVVVRATNTKTKKGLQVISDENGKFYFDLDKNSDYKITFSKESYSNSTQTYKTTIDGKVKKQIGVTMSLSPLAAGSSSEKPKSYEEKVRPKSSVGYSVQLSVQGNDRVIDLTKFSDLNGMGKAYSVPEEGKTKIRLGVFATRTEADAMLKKVAAKGFVGVFVVEEKNTEAVTKYALSAIQPKQPSSSSRTVLNTKGVGEGRTVLVSQTTKEEVIPVSYSLDLTKERYSIRIATMLNANFFDAQKFTDLGEIEEVQQGEYTVFFLHGFPNMTKATQMKEKIISMGYKDAQIIAKKKK